MIAEKTEPFINTDTIRFSPTFYIVKRSKLVSALCHRFPFTPIDIYNQIVRTGLLWYIGKTNASHQRGINPETLDDCEGLRDGYVQIDIDYVNVCLEGTQVPEDNDQLYYALLWTIVTNFSFIYNLNASLTFTSSERIKQFTAIEKIYLVNCSWAEVKIRNNRQNDVTNDPLHKYIDEIMPHEDDIIVEPPVPFSLSLGETYTPSLYKKRVPLYSIKSWLQCKRNAKRQQPPPKPETNNKYSTKTQSSFYKHLRTLYDKLIYDIFVTTKLTDEELNATRRFKDDLNTFELCAKLYEYNRPSLRCVTSV